MGARTSLRGAIAEATQGVTYYESVKQLLHQATDDWPSVLARLEKLRDTLLVKEGPAPNPHPSAPTLRPTLTQP